MPAPPKSNPQQSQSSPRTNRQRDWTASLGSCRAHGRTASHQTEFGFQPFRVSASLLTPFFRPNDGGAEPRDNVECRRGGNEGRWWLAKLLVASVIDAEAKGMAGRRAWGEGDKPMVLLVLGWWVSCGCRVVLRCSLHFLFSENRGGVNNFTKIYGGKNLF
jgi:hypothetical protein